MTKTLLVGACGMMLALTACGVERMGPEDVVQHCTSAAAEKVDYTTYPEFSGVDVENLGGSWSAVGDVSYTDRRDGTVTKAFSCSIRFGDDDGYVHVNLR